MCPVALQHPLFARHGSGLRQSDKAGHGAPEDPGAAADSGHHGVSGLLAGELRVAAAAAAQGGGGGKRVRLSWQHVVAEAYQSVLALFLVYVVTLSIFPGVLAEDVKVK